MSRWSAEPSWVSDRRREAWQRPRAPTTACPGPASSPHGAPLALVNRQVHAREPATPGQLGSAGATSAGPGHTCWPPGTGSGTTGTAEARLWTARGGYVTFTAAWLSQGPQFGHERGRTFSGMRPLPIQEAWA